MARDLDAGARAVRGRRRRRRRCSPRPRRPSCCCRAAPGAPVARRAWRPGMPHLGVMLPVARRCTTCCCARAGLPGGGHQRQPDRRADRHRRARGARAARRTSPTLFLVHDRPIERHVDDSVGCVRRRRAALLRRARGYAPLPVRAGARLARASWRSARTSRTPSRCASGGRSFVSQHIGDLETAEALRRLRARDRRLPAALRGRARGGRARPAPRLRLDRAGRARGRPRARPRARRRAAPPRPPRRLPGRARRRRAGARRRSGTAPATAPTARSGAASSCSATPPATSASRTCARSACPGGDAAVREPRRAALALLWELLGEAALDRDDLARDRGVRPRRARACSARMLARGLNAPSTTSAGRLFDGVAALLGLRPRVTLRGPGRHGAGVRSPTRATRRAAVARCRWLRQPRRSARRSMLDWRPLVAAVLERPGARRGRAASSRRASTTRWSTAIVAVARRVGRARASC